MNLNKALLMVMLLVMSILPAPAISAGVAPIQFTNSIVDGAGLNTDFTISVTVKDADDYITKIALGEAPYKTDDYNTYDCPANKNTCTAVFTVGEGNLHHITSEGTYYFRAFAKNSNNQYAQYDVQVSVAAASNFILRTAAVNGNDYSQGTYTYIPSTIQVIDQAVTTDAFATFSVQPNALVGANYVPTDTAYSSDAIAFFFDERLQGMSGEGATYTANTDVGQAVTTCSLNWATNRYDCELDLAGGVVPFEYQPTGSNLGNHVIRYYKPVFTEADPVINFAGASFEVDEGAAVSIDLSSYIYNVEDVEISVPTVSWANLAVDQDTEVLVVAPYSGARGSYHLPVTITASGVSDTDTVEIIVNDVADDAPVITSAVPTTDLTLNEDSGVYNFAVSAYDPENTLLSFEWQTNDVVQQTGSSNQYAWTIPSANGADRTVVIEAVVADQSGAQTTRTWTATVIDAVPQAALAAVAAINEGQNVTLDASASSMTFNADAISTYEFDIDGDGTYDISQSSPVLVQNYPSNGTYDVTVRVTDDDGSQDTATQTVVVNNVPITNVTLSTNLTSATEPADATYACSAVGGNAPYTFNITQEGIQVADTNGTAMANTLANSTYVIGCTVTDADGDLLSATDVNFTVADAAPTANFTFTPTGVVEGGMIAFTSTSTTPLDAITSYTWSVDAAANASIANANAAVTNITFPLNGTYNVTLDIVDSDGSTDSITQQVAISINDTADPVVANITTLPVNVTINDNVTISAQATDDVGVSSVVFNITTPSPNATTVTLSGVAGANNTWSVNYIPTQVGIYTIDVLATDVVGKTDFTNTLMNVANVTPNNDPVLGAIADINAAVNITTNIPFSATDADNDTLIFAKNITFANETFNSSTGVWSFTPNASEVGVYSVLASVDDGNNGTDSQVFTINVTLTPSNNAPVVTISSPANASSFNTSDAVLFNASATDAEEGDLSININWYSDLDGFLGSNQTLNLTTLSIGTHTITANVTDSGNLTGTDSVVIDILAVGNAPTINITSPLNGSIYNNTDNITLSADANDVEDGNLSSNVTWTSDLDGVLGTGIVSTTLTTGNHTLTATVTDADNNTVNAQVQIEVLTLANNAPVIDPVLDQQATVGVPFTYTFNASDADNDTLTYSFNSTLGSLNATRGVWTYTPALGEEGNYSVLVSVDDGTDSDNTTFNLEVFPNNAPVASVNTSYNVTENTTLQFTVGTTDAENDTITFGTDAYSSLLGADINPSTGVFTYTPAYDEFHQDTTTQININISDAYNTVTVPVNITVLHVNQAPVFGAYAGPSTIGENQTVQISVSATDIDANDTLTYGFVGFNSSVNGTYSMNASSGVLDWTTTFADAGVYNLTFNVTDGSLVDTQTITITVIDNSTVPIATALGNGMSSISAIGPTTVEFTGTYTDGEVPVSEEWRINGFLQSNNANFNYTFTTPGNYTAVYTVTDVDGDSSNDTVTIEIEEIDHDASATNIVVPAGDHWEGDNISVSATISNEGNVAETIPVMLLVGGVVVDTVNVSLAAGASTNQALTWSNAQAGDFTVSIRTNLSTDEDNTNNQVSTTHSVESVADALNTYDLVIFPNDVGTSSSTIGYVIIQNRYATQAFDNIDIRLEADSGVIITSANPVVESLDAGEGTWVQFNITAPASAGNYTVTAFLGNNEVSTSDVLRVI